MFTEDVNASEESDKYSRQQAMIIQVDDGTLNSRGAEKGIEKSRIV